MGKRVDHTAVIVQRPIDRTSAILHFEPAAKLIIEMNSCLCSERAIAWLVKPNYPDGRLLFEWLYILITANNQF
jgi:hypothetical protein